VVVTDDDDDDDDDDEMALTMAPAPRAFGGFGGFGLGAGLGQLMGVSFGFFGGGNPNMLHPRCCALLDSRPSFTCWRCAVFDIFFLSLYFTCALLSPFLLLP
jgi:hypothetical protein